MSSEEEPRYSELKRLAESEEDIIEFWSSVWFELVEAMEGDGLEDDEEDLTNKE